MNIFTLDLYGFSAVLGVPYGVVLDFMTHTG